MLDLRSDTWPARHVESTCPKKQQIPSRQCRGQSRPRLELFPGNDDNVVKIFLVRRQTLKNLWPVSILLGMPPFQKNAVFLNIVQKAFGPPPLLFEHLSYFAGGVFRHNF